MNKTNKLIEELLGFYFIWFPAEFLLLYFTLIKNKYSQNNYDVKTIFIIELIYLPLKIIFNYLFTNNKFLLNKNTSDNAVLLMMICYFVLGSYTFNSCKQILKYLFIVYSMEKIRYYLFELLKKIIEKYSLNTVYKIMSYIPDFSIIFICILFYFKKFGLKEECPKLDNQ